MWAKRRLYVLVFIFLNTGTYAQNKAERSVINGIDTFKYAYKTRILGREKKEDKNIYVGTTSATLQINGKAYRQYDKNKGFLKFEIMSHWFPVNVYKHIVAFSDAYRGAAQKLRKVPLSEEHTMVTFE